MKKVLIVCLVALLTPAALAELVSNYDFSAGDDGSWSYTAGVWGGPYFYNDGSDDIISMGGWGDGRDGTGSSNASIWQNTGATFAADTVYTLNVVWRDPGDGGLDVESIQASIIDVTGGWVDVAADWYGPLAVTDEWTTATLVFDTASNPALVGNNIGVGVRLTSNVGSWVHLNSVSLVPEPATLALLGLGGLILRRKRR